MGAAALAYLRWALVLALWGDRRRALWCLRCATRCLARAVTRWPTTR